MKFQFLQYLYKAILFIFHYIYLLSFCFSEAVELCLRRNLMFLQENPDFTSLSLDTRTRLYIANMGSMCHVRGVMQRGTSAAASSSNFTCVSGDNNLLQISYKNQVAFLSFRRNVSSYIS